MQINFIHSRNSAHSIRRALAVVAAGTIAFGVLTGCAPEPEIPTPDEITTQTDEETKWPELDKEPEKVTVLPADFPDAFPVPEGVEIYDVGSRDDGSWYLVLRAPTAAEADALWQQIIAAGNFEAADAVETVEGGTSATLTSEKANVAAMSLPQEDGSVLMNYDISVFTLMP